MSSGHSLRVGFIGLGNMGMKMATNLIQKGYEIAVNDINHNILEGLRDQGAVIVKTPADLMREDMDVDVVLTMLPNSGIVQRVYLGEHGLLSANTLMSAQCNQKLKTMIDASTIAPSTSQKVAKQALEHGIHVLDAPVSGGVVGAAAGTLTFMVGGDQVAYNRMQSLLSAMGKRSVYCGSSGSGQAVKLCNNLALAIQMASIAESMSLGAKLGLDLSILSDVFNMSSARCWSSDTYNPCPGIMEDVPATREYDNGFATSLMIKDIKLALESAETYGNGGLPMGEKALEIYERMALMPIPQGNESYASKDFGAIYKYFYDGPPHNRQTAT